MAHTFDQAKFDDRKSKRQAAKQAVGELNTIIENIDAANVAQSKDAIKKIAQHQKHIIRLVAGEAT